MPLDALKRFAPRTLYGKLASLFLLVVFVLGLIQVYISASGWIGFVQESEQRLHWDVAQRLAAKIAIHHEETLDHQAIDNALAELLLPPAQFDLYIVDASGKILYFQAPPERIKQGSIAMEPLRRFMGQSALGQGAILADDPKHPGERTVFSAAPLPDSDYFVYVVLGANQYSSILRVLGKSYFLDATLLGTVAALSAAVLVGLLGFFILTKPLRAIAEVIRSYQSGDYSARYQARSGDEVEEVASTLQLMAETIERKIEELESANQLRRELVANISHDLRSPLTAMRSCIDATVLRIDDLSPSEVKAQLEAAQGSLSFLQQLVEELFELSKLESGTVEPDYELFNIEELCDDIVMQLSPKAKEKGIELIGELHDGPVVSADIRMMSKVIANLVENAIRYTEPDGTVRLCCSPQDGEILIEVVDNGIGIAAEELDKVFDRFYRVDQSRNLNNGSTGLGLAIVKQVLEVHGIAIRLDSEVGRGSRFWFTIPPYRSSSGASR